MARVANNAAVERDGPQRRADDEARLNVGLSDPSQTSIDPGLDKISYVLDQAIRIPGTNIRFGIDPIISFLFPFAGDSIATLVSAYIVIASVRYGLPKVVIGRMVFNIAVDYLIGTVPFVGDLFDFAWKSNKKNMQLLNRHALGKGRSKWSDWVWVFILLGGLGIFVFGVLALILLAFRTFTTVNLGS